jgi:SP family arabinose:H+ symporter-like MFS transporter
MWIADTIGTAATFWTFAAFCVIAFITVYKLLPETKGKSLEQIEAEWNGSAITAEHTIETSSEPIAKMFH